MGKTSTRSDSKSNRKFEKKLQFYSKVKEAVASLSAQKSIAKKKNRQQKRQNKLKAYNLSSLLESLPELKASRKPGHEEEFKLSCKSRQKLILKEGERCRRFLRIISSKQDPVCHSSTFTAHTTGCRGTTEEKGEQKWIQEEEIKVFNWSTVYGYVMPVYGCYRKCFANAEP